MEENRKHQRCPIHWRSAIVVEDYGKPETIQCKTNDISINGVSVICHRNVAVGHPVNVFLLVDPGGPSHPQVIVEVLGKIMNNVLSGQQGGYRLGIQFSKFARDGQQVLRNHLPREAMQTKKIVAPPPPPPPPPPSPTTPVDNAEAEDHSANVAADGDPSVKSPPSGEATPAGGDDAAGGESQATGDGAAQP